MEEWIGGPVSPEINNGVESCTICVLWRITKAPPRACTRPPWPDPPFMSSFAALSKKLSRRECSLPLPSLSLPRIIYTRDCCWSLGGKKKKRKKKERKEEKEREEMGAGAFVPPAFYLGSACSRACGRSLPAVYEGRKQWPR